MAEFEPKLPNSETEPSVENSAEQKEKLQKLIDQAKEATNEHAASKEHLGHTAKQEALTAKETQGKIGEKEHPKPDSHMYITRATKKAAYKKTLGHVRRQLPKRERAFSKVIHQPVVEKLSDVGSKTVARPSGVLAGGICALLGSTFVFYMAKHYGFEYNFLVFILLLVIGFGVGLVVELLWNSTRKIRQR